MIPLADASRRPKRFPVVTAAIILLNAIVFLFELLGGEPFVKQWSVIPADIVSGQHWVTIISAMFMHGGWMHILLAGHRAKDSFETAMEFAYVGRRGAFSLGFVCRYFRRTRPGNC